MEVIQGLQVTSPARKTLPDLSNTRPTSFPLSSQITTSPLPLSAMTVSDVSV